MKSDTEFLNLVARREGIASLEESWNSYNKKPNFTPDILSEFLKKKGATARYNVITKQNDFTGFSEENEEFLPSNITPLLYSELQGTYKYCTMNTIDAYLNIIVSRNSYNPVLELLDKHKWDGEERLDELYKLLYISSDDILSKILIKKWLMQCIALLHNQPDKPFGADGVLCLTGNQGVGKTSFFRALSLKSDFFKEGIAINFHDKDSYIRALSCWICELGEVESTLRTDIEKLKAFITQSKDEYRKPYGRGDICSVRRTSFCATCNSTEFLIDTSGNRRFWTIPINKIDIDKLKEFDFIQLWKEVEHIVNLKGLQEFRLTEEEQKMLAVRNGTHEKPMKAEVEIRDILSDNGGSDYTVEWEYMTVSEFKALYESLRNYTGQQISSVLNKLGIEQTIKKVNGKSQRLRFLPKRKYKYNYN